MRKDKLIYVILLIVLIGLISIPEDVSIEKQVVKTSYLSSSSAKINQILKQTDFEEIQSLRIGGNIKLNETATTMQWEGNGTAGNPFIISEYIITANDTEEALLIYSTNMSVLITNCIIGDAERAIRLTGTKNIVIDFNVFKNCSSSSTDANIDISHSEKITISNNIIHNENVFHYGSDIGIRLWRSSNISIVNNTIHHFTYGVYIGDTNSSFIYNNTIFECENGIKVVPDCQFLSLENNTIYDGFQNGIVFSVEKNENRIVNFSTTVVNNTLFRCGENGIYLVYSSGVTIHSNLIFDTLWGIYTYWSSDNQITNNTIFNNCMYGVKLYGSDNIEIAHNNFIGNRHYLFDDSQLEQDVKIFHQADLAQINDIGTSLMTNEIVKNYWGATTQATTQADENSDSFFDQSYYLAGNTSNFDSMPRTTAVPLTRSILSIPKIFSPIGYEALKSSHLVNWSSGIQYPSSSAVTYSIYYGLTENNSIRINSIKSWVLLTDQLTDTSYTWDTSKLEDGWYHVKIVAKSATGLIVEDTSDHAFSIGIERRRNQGVGEFGGSIPGFSLLTILLGLSIVLWCKKQKLKVK